MKNVIIRESRDGFHSRMNAAREKINELEDI